MRIYDASDIDAAWSRIMYLAQTREFDIFRGQKRHWPLLPSLVRQSGQDLTDAINALTAFREWAAETPAMAPYVPEQDADIAIAQHYGIPTNLLDWTYDPATAFFFALDGADPDDHSQAVIFCAKSSEIRNASYCRLIEIRVPNLWRLEAQSGLFVEIQNANAAQSLESSCEIIRFPKPDDINFDRSRFYPVRKSDLEIKIDQFMQRHAVVPLLDAIFAQTKYSILNRWRTYPGAFWGRMPTNNVTWETDVGWRTIRQEPYLPFHPHSIINIKIDKRAPIRRRFEKIRASLGADPAIPVRTYHVKFNITGISNKDKKALIEKSLTTYWDGVRRLPFANADVIDGLSALACLCSEYCLSKKTIERTFSLLFGKATTVEFSDINGLHQAGIASLRGLDGSISRPILDHVTPYVRRKATETPESLFCFILDCEMICDLPAFSALMAREVAPSQIARNFVQVLSNKEWDAVFEAPSYDPTGLGYFSTSSYRFDYPFAIDPQPEDIIFLFSDMSEEEIAAEVLSAELSYRKMERPFFLRLHSWSRDTREIYEIEESIAILKTFAAYGGLSLLEISENEPAVLQQAFKNPKSPHPAPLGAFTIWRFINGLGGKQPNEDEFHEILTRFMDYIKESNSKLDQFVNAFTADS